ncbi:hypothetical protein GB937_010563 [Aspergillus fischeri]|nr:hypothetical protein GB937_010563 [Aspergillus fischeri]
MHLFGEKRVQELEILAIQEPSISRHTAPVSTHSQAVGGRFHVLLRPTAPADVADTPRVCFLVNKRLDPNTWSIRHWCRDLSTLTLQLTGRRLIHIRNIYNPSPQFTQQA